MYGSNMFCHVALAREHFLAVGARNALNTAVFSLSHMNVPEEVITEPIEKLLQIFRPGRANRIKTFWTQALHCT